MNSHRNDFILHFIFPNSESISLTPSQEAALKSSFVSVYEKDSFVCIGYIYSEKFQRVFAYGKCITKINVNNKKDFYSDFSVKSTSESSGVKDVQRTQNFLAIFVSIYI